MKARVTITLIPESRQEMISTYPPDYRLLREAVEKSNAMGSFLLMPPDKVDIRWILLSGRWE